MNFLFVRLFLGLFLFCNIAFADELNNDIAQKKDDFLSFFSEKKKDFYSFKIDTEEYAVNPYIGIGYAFSVGKFTDNGPNYTQYVPGIFNNAYFMIGTKIGEGLLFEIGGTAGGTSTSSTGSATLNGIHFNVGYEFGEDLLGEYGDKNKIIVLAGVVMGITSATANGTVLANNYISAAPELGVAYQRFINDRISLRFDARMSSAQVYQVQGSVMGTFIASVLFHL